MLLNIIHLILSWSFMDFNVSYSMLIPVMIVYGTSGYELIFRCPFRLEMAKISTFISAVFPAFFILSKLT